MPEEQAFCVLVKMMFDYGLRDLFKQGFEELHLRFYQLERLMQVKKLCIWFTEISKNIGTPTCSQLTCVKVYCVTMRKVSWILHQISLLITRSNVQLFFPTLRSPLHSMDVVRKAPRACIYPRLFNRTAFWLHIYPKVSS